MDENESFHLMLTSLLHLHQTLDPPPTTPSPPLSSPSPLLFFTLSSILQYLSNKKPRIIIPEFELSQPDPEYTLESFRELVSDPDYQTRDGKFRERYGLSYPLFGTVVGKLKVYIEKSCLSVPADYAVSIVLSRLALGLSPKALSKRYSLEPYLISKITNMVTRLIATKLYPEFIQIPVSRRRVVENSVAFQDITDLPNVCGAIAGTAVKVRSNDQDLQHRQHGYPALLLQVVADHKKIFWDVCVKAPGGSDNATHLRDSLLYHRLTSGDVIWDKVVNVRGQHVRPYIVGGSDYPMLSFLLTPFGRPATPAQREFDSALLKGKRVVDEAIGLLKGRWKILQDLNVGLNHAPQTIVACCVLHNLCQIAREPEPDMWREPESGEVARVVESEKTSRFYGESFRQALADDLYQRISR